MISFRHRSNVKRIKIKTNKRLDERMSGWLQKVFNIKSPIVGFKSQDNKYYDVETFYLLIDNFYNSQVEIVESNEQPEISFTSDNLNSSSFIRPSQPNTSELNHKGPSSEQDDVTFVSDIKMFEKKLTEGRDISILFDIHPGFKRQVVEGVGDLLNAYGGAKAAIYILISRNHPKKSNFSIYMGKNCVVVIPLTLQYKSVILNAISKVKHVPFNQDQNRALKPPAEDEAPSFTTHHLQERLNQDACFDYLGRMSREKILSSYQYHKLLEKVQDNFSDFYKIFCDGVMDNDYESFKNEIRLKVENNLEMLLSNVEEMDLSRPISREEQRKQNLRKASPDIEIVKVQNYFEVLDLIKDRLDQKYLGEIKQHLLDQNQELCSYFSKFIAREYGKEELTRKVAAFAQQTFDDLRPISRCVPRSKSTEGVRKEERRIIDVQDLQEAPMFGSLNIASENVVSPIKNMSDIQSLYKLAWEKLQSKADYFSAEEYGLLYHYLQTNNDCILNFVQELDEQSQSSFLPLKGFLSQKMSIILAQSFNQTELACLESIKGSLNVAPIYENFRYECDVGSFIAALREEISRVKQPAERVLHKKSSDSQLLEKAGKQRQKRKFSDQNQESPSPRQSDISLYQRGSEFSLYNLRLLANPWADEFEEMLQFCDFREPQKEEYLRSAYGDYNPSLFLWVREFIKNKQTNQQSAEYFRENVNKREWQHRGLLKILPLYSQLLKQFERQGKLTDKMRKWAVMSFMECSLSLLGSFQLYLLQKDEQELIDSIRAAYSHEDKEMELYRLYSSRIETMLKEMCINNQASLQIFKQYPIKIKSFIDVYYFTGDFEDLMENLHTLETLHIQKSKLSVATLNFSGINTNPFEYDDGSEMFIKLNENVQQLMKLDVPGMTEWKVGKIDKDFTSSARLSVAFSKNIDSINGKLLTREQFAEMWRSKFDNWEDKEKVKATEEEISMSIRMDYIFYKSLVKYVYNVPTFEELDQQLKTYQPHILNDFLAKKFDRPASKLDLKEDYVISYLLHSKIDVFCLQEAGSIDWKEELIPQYSYHKNHDSVILYRKEKFGRVRQDLMDQYGKDLDFNNDTSFIFTTKNYLLISAHLKSKKIHFQQAEAMFKVLKGIKEEHPLLRIVIGMDANHFLLTENFLNQQGLPVFCMVPDSPQKPTTVKKRSFMQAQYKKAGLEVSEVKDEIVTTHKIVEWGIEKISGQESTGELLPNDIHPYDHYVVKAVIKFL